METLAAIGAGLGLAAACGFRVFLPLLVMGIAVHSEWIEPASGFEWVGSWPAMIAFGTATAFEVGAYYVPWLDNLLDTAASPAALVAGTVAAAAFLPEAHPAIKWSAAIVAGGGSAAVIQTGSVFTRAVSSLTTGGLGNPVVSTTEAAGSVSLSIVAVLVPLLALLFVVVIVVMAVWLIARRRGRRVELAE